jgi:hypothetical protein
MAAGLAAGIWLMGGCASSKKDGFSGPGLNTDEPQYDSSMQRSKDRPQLEKGAQVDFFKFKQGF